MNPQPPIDQNALHIYRGNIAELRARVSAFRIARATLRKWSIPSYARKSAFSAYETQMKLIFEDAELSEVAMGQAIRTIPVPNEQPTDTIRRRLYDECNFQIYSHIFRSFTSASGVAWIITARKVFQPTFCMLYNYLAIYIQSKVYIMFLWNVDAVRDHCGRV